MVISPEPNFSAASAILICSSVVSFPFLVITRTLNTSPYRLSCRHPSPLTRLISSAESFFPSRGTFTLLKNAPPSRTLVFVYPKAFRRFCKKYPRLPFAHTSSSLASLSNPSSGPFTLDRSIHVAPGMAGAGCTSSTVYPLASPFAYSAGLMESSRPSILFSRI